MQHILTKYFYIAFVTFYFRICESYKIVVVFPINFKSHKILGDSCVDLLLQAGHEVTYITWGPYSMESHRNLSVIDVSVPKSIEFTFNLEKHMEGEPVYSNLQKFMMTISVLNRQLLEHDKIQNLLSDPKESFDVAILEWLYADYVVGIPAVFGCPYIWISSQEPHSLILGMLGEISNPAITALCNFKNIPPFTFMERVRSLRDVLSSYVYREFYIQPIEEQEYRRVVAPLITKRRGVVPPYNELRYNASLILGNSHVSVGRAIPLPEAYKAIGGYHVLKKREILPEDLKLLMDNSPNGVIYFSLGTAVPSQYFPVEITKKLLTVFGQLKQTVLWKFEADLPDRPSNVHITSWAPQQGILAHPNCVLFISHGGQLSILETVHYGVPLIGIPIFADQYANVKSLAKKGMAKQVDLHFDMAEDLKMAINEILGNSSYTEAAKYQSFIYHHRPVSPDIEMVYWVEHVIKTKGAAYLRSVTLAVPWYHRCYLDLAIIAFVVMILLFLIMKRLFLVKSNELKQAGEKKLQ